MKFSVANKIPNSLINSALFQKAIKILDTLKSYRNNTSTSNIVITTTSKPLAEARIIGGYVRDILLGITPKDLDIATNLLPEESELALSQIGCNIIRTGIQHGTITAVIDKVTIEITTLRKDIDCDGRKAVVMYSNSWFDDAARRDFTINALSMDSNFDVYDYFNGIDDIKRKIVRFIGDPEIRIHEDYLRILRYFRFLCLCTTNLCTISDNAINDNIDDNISDNKLADIFRDIDTPSFNAVIKLAYKMSKLSRERIRCEMMRLFGMKNACYILEIMQEHGILHHANLILQNHQSNQSNQKSIKSQKIAELQFIQDECLVNLIGTLINFHFSTVTISELCSNWKMSNKEQSTILKVCECFCDLNDQFIQDLQSIGYIDNVQCSVQFENACTQAQAQAQAQESLTPSHTPLLQPNKLQLHRKYLFQLGNDIYIQYIKILYVLNVIKYAVYLQLLHDIQIVSSFYPVPKMPINGYDMIQIGLQKQAISKALDFAQKIWIKSEFTSTKADLMNQILESLILKH